MEQQFKYFAFISYNSKDTEWGKRVQKKLEHYCMPATLCREHGWESRTPIKPVLFDAEGNVVLEIPLKEQRAVYPITTTIVTLTDSVIMMPCGQYDIIKI